MNDNHYVFNKHGVCTNGDVVYFFPDPEIDSWLFVKIVVCEFNGFWDYGFKAAGCCSPLTNQGKFPTREGAIEQAILMVKECFKEDRGLGNFTSCITHFDYWLSNRGSENIVKKDMVISNYNFPGIKQLCHPGKVEDLDTKSEPTQFMPLNND
jgi:hypothetical protein